MKNKTILVVLYVILLLLFTSLSYGGWGDLKPKSLEPQVDQLAKHEKVGLPEDPPPGGPGEPDLEDPWDNLLSPPTKEDEGIDIVTIIINLGFYYMFYTF